MPRPRVVWVEFGKCFGSGAHSRELKLVGGIKLQRMNAGGEHTHFTFGNIGSEGDALIG
jgi:hypothetical protein